MKKATQTILSGALCAAMIMTAAPAGAFAATAAVGGRVNTQLNALSEDDEEDSIGYYSFSEAHDPGFDINQVTFDVGSESGWSDDVGQPMKVYKGKDYILGDQWYKCIDKTKDKYSGYEYDYIPFSGTPSEPGIYALKVTGIGDYEGTTTYAYLIINDTYDLERCDVSIVEPGYDADWLVIGETTNKPKLRVTYRDWETDKETVLKEGVDYERVGWFKSISNYDSNDEILEFVGDRVSEPADEYLYGVRGIGKYHGENQTYSVSWTFSSNFGLFTFKTKNQLQLGKDNFDDLKVTASRKTASGKKLNLKEGKDFAVSNWCGLCVEDGYWRTDSDKIIKTPSKTGVYGIVIKGLGKYKGQETNLNITVFKPKMTYNLPTLDSDTLAKNTKITNLTLGNKVGTIFEYALKGCTNLKTLTFGKDVDCIYRYAFKDCKKLKTITVKSAKIENELISRHAFSDSNVTTIKVDTGNKKTDKKVIKAYKKIFTKAICGKDLIVK